MFKIAVPRGKLRISLLFESLEAARWRGISDQDYDTLPIEDKARLIAHYRTHMQIQAVEAWEIRRKRG